MSTWTALRRRYGASSTTLPIWLRLLLTAPFVLIVANCVLAVVATGLSVYTALSLVPVLFAVYAFVIVVPHFWVRSDRSVRDERREQALARRLRQELALREVREGSEGSAYDDVPTSLWHLRPTAPTRW